MLIQVLLVVAIVVGGILLLRTGPEHRSQAIRRLLVVGVGLLAVVSVTAPSLVTRIAAVLGVGRGTDLLLYALVVTFFGYTVTSYRRNRHLEEQLTVLARSIALTEAAAAHAEHEVARLRRDPARPDPDRARPAPDPNRPAPDPARRQPSISIAADPMSDRR